MLGAFGAAERVIESFSAITASNTGCGGQALVSVSSTGGGRFLPVPVYANIPVITGKAGILGKVMVRTKGKRVHADLYLDPERHHELQRLSAFSRIPMAAYLREAVDDLLKKHATTLKKAK